MATKLKKQYDVATTFTFKGEFRVYADNEEHAKRMVEEQCDMRYGKVDTEIPLNEIGWNFGIFPDTKIDRVIPIEE